jgi:hypothetical protein
MRTLAAIVSLALASAAAAADPAPAPDAPGTPPATGAPPAPAPAEVYGKASGLLPGFLIGPSLHLLPIPSVVGVGMEARILDTLGVALDYNLIPSVGVPGAESADAKMEYRDLSGAVRWFPWRRAFYLGAALGTRTFKATATDTATGLRGTAEVTSTYLAPEIGWRWIWPSGFFLGMDLGYQVILSSKETFDLPASLDPVDKQDLEDAANDLGKIGFPILSLLQLGWYF